MSDKEAQKELGALLRELTNRRGSFFAYGRFSCSRKLANGARVRFSITMPPLKKPSKRRPKRG